MKLAFNDGFWHCLLSLSSLSKLGIGSEDSALFEDLPSPEIKGLSTLS